MAFELPFDSLIGAPVIIDPNVVGIQGGRLVQTSADGALITEAFEYIVTEDNIILLGEV